jgi:hypothetical protein
MSYGVKSNDDLLLNYGFVESDNQGDVFEFPDLLGWVKQRRGQVINTDRLEELFTKGLEDSVRCGLLSPCLFVL